jgi:hypothetical protein
MRQVAPCAATPKKNRLPVADACFFYLTLMINYRWKSTAVSLERRDHPIASG